MFEIAISYFYFIVVVSKLIPLIERISSNNNKLPFSNYLINCDFLYSCFWMETKLKMVCNTLEKKDSNRFKLLFMDKSLLYISFIHFFSIRSLLISLIAQKKPDEAIFSHLPLFSADLEVKRLLCKRFYARPLSV